MNTPALERIAFQIKSPLATKLVAAVQSAMDELKTSREMVGDRVIPADIGRVRRATKILKKSFSPEIVKICKDELNLAANVELISDDVAWGNMAMGIVYKKYSDNYDFLVVSTGFDLFSGIEKEVPKEYDRDYFKHFADDLDLCVSKLKTYTDEIVVHLFFFTTSFMTEEIFDTTRIPPITAEEHAAGIVHELGHALTMIEHLSDMYYQSELATNTIKYLNEKSDAPTLKETVASITQDSDPKQIPELQTAAKSLKRLGLDDLDLVLFSPIIALIYIVVTFLNPFLYLIQGGLYGKINSTFEKTSDTVVTQSNASYVERIADEFTARHGLASAFITGTAKEVRYYQTGSVHSNFSDAVKAMGVIKATLLSYKVLIKCLSPILFFSGDTYDPELLRYEHILLNTLVVFKDENLEIESREYFIGEVKYMIKIIDELRSQKSTKIRQFLWGTIFSILSRSSISDSFSTAGLSADYDKLQLATNGLIKIDYIFMLLV